MISERLREGRTEGTDLRWHVTDVHREAADVIDALVAALERAANEGQKGQLSLHTLMACGDALARARRK